MNQFQINSFDSVNNFLFEIYSRSEKTFDPAVDVKDLKDNKDNPVFTEFESAYLNEVLTQCFIFCVSNDLNIDTITAMVQCDFRSLKPHV